MCHTEGWDGHPAEMAIDRATRQSLSKRMITEACIKQVHDVSPCSFDPPNIIVWENVNDKLTFRLIATVLVKYKSLLTATLL